MIAKIKGILEKKTEDHVYVVVGGLSYEIEVPRAVSRKISVQAGEEIELVTYYFLRMEKNRGVPVVIGFQDELERDFFLQFTGVSGIGPRAALRALDRPVSAIAGAIEEGDIRTLSSLQGIGKQKAKQIVAHLQGKVGRFLLIREEKEEAGARGEYPFIAEARQVLKRLGYSVRESESMIKKVLEKHPHLETIEEFLNKIYYEKR